MKVEKQVKENVNKAIGTVLCGQRSSLEDNRSNAMLQNRLVNDIRSGNRGLSSNASIGKKISNGIFANPNSKTLQRAIGFEFEVIAPLVKKVGSNYKDTEYQKGQAIHAQNEFDIVQDYASQKIDNISTIPEFVIHPKGEELDCNEFLTNVNAAIDYIKKDPIIKKFPNDTQIGTTPRNGLKTTSVSTGQATYGVRLGGIGNVFKAKLPKVESNIGLFEKEILNKAILATDNIMRSLELPPEVEKDKITGYILLICQYCASNSNQFLQYTPGVIDKNKVPFLVRSSFGDIAKATLSENSLKFLREKEEDISELIIQYTEAVPGSPIIFPTADEQNKLPNEPVSKWVSNVLLAQDKPLNWGSVADGSDSKIIKPEIVGMPSSGEMGAVLEERNLTRTPVSVENWAILATEIWKTVREANKKDEDIRI